MNQSISEQEKTKCVDAWLADVAAASRRWKTAKEAQRSSESVVGYLEHIRASVKSASPDLVARMDEAIEANRENARKLAEAADCLADLESGFYAVLERVDNPEVAEAWRMRYIGGKTWYQCSMALHYNRQHLERLSKRAKVAVYPAIPEGYRNG